MNILYVTNVVCYAQITVKACSNLTTDTAQKLSKHANISLQLSCQQNSAGIT